jgi:hypothetical protein
MLSAKGLVSLCSVLAATSLAVVCAGCGSSSSSHTMSQAQAQAVSHEVVTAVEDALSSALGSPATSVAHPSLATVVSDIHPDQSSGCTITATGETCNVPISYSGPCPDGGTISVSGDFNFTLDSSGSGKNTESLTITPTNCAVESNLTINGDPDITIGTQINFQGGQIEFPVTATEGGGVSYGPNPSGSCTLNVTLTVSSQTSCTVTGTVCGQPVSGSC